MFAFNIHYMSLWAFLDLVMVLSHLYSLNFQPQPFSSTSIIPGKIPLY